MVSSNIFEGNEKVNVGMVQINNSFNNQNYFPYSIGMLQAYAQKHLDSVDRFEFLSQIYKRIPIDKAVQQLSLAEIVFFSTYVWNFNLSSKIAERIKAERPETVVVFGGCHVPRNDTESFIQKMPFVDIVCYGEGEETFNSILENFLSRKWNNIPSISYREQEGKIITNPRKARISDLSKIPSPYLSGVFDKIMRENPQETWLGLWETNRGCPFGCDYCEWGGEYHKKLVHHNIGKLCDEIDWFSQNKVEFIFCCDSNFGISKRDLELARRVADNKKRYGYPKVLSVQNTKNSTHMSYDIQKVLSDAGLSKGVNLAFQSLNQTTLNVVGRKNISNATFSELQQRFNSEGIETFSDIILGLPEETYESFLNGLELLIENGQKNRIQINNLSLLPNSRMGSAEYQKKYGIKFIENAFINIHGSLSVEEVQERQKLVIGTSTMPPVDWVRARSFGWMLSMLYFDKIIQIPMTLLRNEYNVAYKDITSCFLNADEKTSPFIATVSSFFQEKAKNIQNGDAEFCESKKWLNIWWPADELAIIELFASGNIDNFYSESKELIEDFLERCNLDFDTCVISDSIELNKQLMKRPFQAENLVLTLGHNIWEAYHSDSIKKPVPVQKKKSRYQINRTSEVWNSWEEWCQKVIWYGNKRGLYMYSCKPSKNDK